MRTKRTGNLAHPDLEHFPQIACACGLTEGIGPKPMIAVGGKDKPVCVHLADFLGKSHSAQKICDTFGNRPLGSW